MAIIYTPSVKNSTEIRHMVISSDGKLIIYSQQSASLASVSTRIRFPVGIGFLTLDHQRVTVYTHVHLYSLNAKLLHEKEVAKPVNALVVVDKYLITGNDVGYLYGIM